MEENSSLFGWVAVLVGLTIYLVALKNDSKEITPTWVIPTYVTGIALIVGGFVSMLF